MPQRVLLFATVLVAGLFSVHNLDIFLHARTGEWIVEHREVPTTNVLSRLHADHPTVDDKWGFQLLAHGLLDGIGPNAVLVARLAVMLALFGVLAVTARRLGAGPWWTLLMLLLALLAARARFTFRPDLLSLALTALFVQAVIVRRPDGRGLLWLLPLQVLWANLHGYFITGPLIVATVAVGHALGGAEGRAAARRFAALALGLLAVCLINPAGWRGWLHPFAILSDLRAHADFYRQAIAEFLPPLADDPRRPWDRAGFLCLAALSLPVLLWDVAVRRGPDRRPALVALILALLFAAMATSLRRNMAPFAVVVAPLAAAAASRRLPDLAAGRALPVALALLLMSGEASDAISIHDGLDRRFGTGLSGIAYPDAGIDFIAEHLPERSVFTAFSYGSTFTGRRWPEQAAATDGNTHGYPTSYLIEVMSALSGEDPLAFDRLAERDGHDVALIPMAGPLSFQLLGHPAWALVCVGVREAVYVRRESVSARWLEEHDRLARWRAGDSARLPDTPVGPDLPLLPRVRAPLAELDQATLLMAAGLEEAALQRARDAQRVSPDDGEPLALEGLILLRAGRPDQARSVLQASLDAGGFNRLADQAAAALESL